MTPATVAVALLGSLAMVWDLRSGRIPNWLAGGGVVAGLACAAASGGARGLATAAAGALLGFAIFFALHWTGGMGGGDVKLMAALGSLLGPWDILAAAVLAAMVGGLWAVALLLWTPKRASIPYAPAIVIGAWLALWGRN
jgi:prepilin peptidase CpaA